MNIEQEGKLITETWNNENQILLQIFFNEIFLTVIYFSLFYLYIYSFINFYVCTNTIIY